MDEKIDDESITSIKDNIDKSQRGIIGEEQMLMCLEKYKYRLQAIFEHYCSVGDSENLTKLKNAKFIKLLRESNIIKPLGVNV